VLGEAPSRRNAASGTGEACAGVGDDGRGNSLIAMRVSVFVGDLLGLVVGEPAVGGETTLLATEVSHFLLLLTAVKGDVGRSLEEERTTSVIEVDMVEESAHC